MIQSVRHEYNDAYSFAQLCDMAEESKEFPSRVDVNDPEFSLTGQYGGSHTDSTVRRQDSRYRSPWESLTSVVYRSLAQSYGETVSRSGEDRQAGPTTASTSSAAVPMQHI